MSIKKRDALPDTHSQFVQAADFPPLSSGDSIDWEDPSPADIQSRVLSGTKSGSILLFHNDLANTGEALPFILTSLLQKGFEFVRTEDMIYYDSYRIDRAGKQIYEPELTASSGAVSYSDNYYVDSAFEKLRQNLTLDEIYGLSVFGRDKAAIIERTRDFLSSAEIAAIQMMSYDELYAAYTSLVYAAETYGAAGGDTPEQEVSSGPEHGIWSEAGGEEEQKPSGGGNSGGEQEAPPVTEETEYPPINENDPEEK